MKPSPLFFLILCLFQGAQSADIVAETCKKIAGPDINYEFCVSSLQADPNSHNADLQGLGVISMKLTKANSTSVQSHIQSLLNDKSTDSATKKALKDCKELYSDANDTIDEAIADMNLKDYKGANLQMSSAIDAASTCEDGFKEQKVVSPLTKEDNDYTHLALIALDITHMFF